MLDLCLHCGAHHVDRDDIWSSPTPTRTRSWVPVPHLHLLSLVEGTLEGCGLRICNEAHALWGGGQRYFGLMELEDDGGRADYSLVLGVRNSHDKSFPAGIALGSGVFVCDNLAFSSEVVLTRRHTRFIERDLPQIVHRAVAQLTAMRGTQDQRIETYRSRDLSDRNAHDLLIRSLDAQVLPVTQLPNVLSEWRNPSHPEFAKGGKTAWRLFNAFTEALKGRNLAALPRRTQSLHGLLDAACGLSV